jgi:spore maturation protein CgeB
MTGVKNKIINRILIVGSWRWEIYEDAFAKSLNQIGIDVISFSTNKYFKGYFGKIEEALPPFSISLYKLNIDLYKFILSEKPDVVLFWRPTHILPITITLTKKLNIFAVSFNNDDPFGPKIHKNVPWHHHFLWFWYLKSLRLYNKNFFYRKVNTLEAEKWGSKNNQVLMPYFIPWRDKPVKLTDVEKVFFCTEVVFIGHYETDGRELLFKSLLEANIKVKIWGGDYWNREVLGDMYDKFTPIVPVQGEDYAKALCGAKICLGLISKLNRDSYTRRCFEIPACGSLLLAERTDDLLSLFIEDEEACFFSSSDELVEKVVWLLSNDEIRLKIADAGFRKVWSSGHDVISRANFFVENLF